eukprot:356607-Chlamydomonas_euryale.AAC.1
MECSPEWGGREGQNVQIDRIVHLNGGDGRDKIRERDGGDRQEWDGGDRREWDGGDRREWD